jgi:hypothetical protein
MDFERGPDGGRGGLKSDAFRVDDDGISSNWVEYTASGSFEKQLARTGKLLATQRCVRKSHACGVMNVGQIKEAGTALEKPISVVHDPIEDPPPNPGHALMKGVSPRDAELLQALALLVTVHSFSTGAVAMSKERFVG